MLSKAFQDRFIQENPFQSKNCIPVDVDKQFYVTREPTDAIISHCDAVG